MKKVLDEAWDLWGIEFSATEKEIIRGYGDQSILYYNIKNVEKAIQNNDFDVEKLVDNEKLNEIQVKLREAIDKRKVWLGIPKNNLDC